MDAECRWRDKVTLGARGAGVDGASCPGLTPCVEARSSSRCAFGAGVFGAMQGLASFRDGCGCCFLAFMRRGGRRALSKRAMLALRAAEPMRVGGRACPVDTAKGGVRKARRDAVSRRGRNALASLASRECPHFPRFLRFGLWLFCPLPSPLIRDLSAFSLASSLPYSSPCAEFPRCVSECAVASDSPSAIGV